MKLKYMKNLIPAIDGMQKVSAICWSPNNLRLAVATADRFIHLFDENGEHKDKFPTKPAEKGHKSYIVRGLQYSPDSQKLAVHKVIILSLCKNWEQIGVKRNPSLTNSPKILPFHAWFGIKHMLMKSSLDFQKEKLELVT